MTFGWADPALNPNMGVEYYESVMATMGPGHARLLPPLHDAGASSTVLEDRAATQSRTLATVIDWVERGRAPATIPRAKVVDGRTIRTRPLCPYPEVARYKGRAVRTRRAISLVGQVSRHESVTHTSYREQCRGWDGSSSMYRRNRTTKLSMARVSVSSRTPHTSSSSF
jgi:hypothetical protein